MQSQVKNVQNRLEQLINELEIQFKDSMTENQNINFQSELEKYGLSGEHLEFKYHLLKKFHDKFMSSKTMLWLKRYYSCFEVLLNSLSKIFPTIEIILEFLGFFKSTFKARENKKL